MPETPKNTPQPASTPAEHPALAGDFFAVRPRQNRTTLIGMRGSPGELARLNWAAKVAGLSVSDLLRSAITEWIERHIPADAKPPAPPRAPLSPRSALAPKKPTKPPHLPA